MMEALAKSVGLIKVATASKEGAKVFLVPDSGTKKKAAITILEPKQPLKIKNEDENCSRQDYSGRFNLFRKIKITDSFSISSFLSDIFEYMTKDK